MFSLLGKFLSFCNFFNCKIRGIRGQEICECFGFSFIFIFLICKCKYNGKTIADNENLLK